MTKTKLPVGLRTRLREFARYQHVTRSLQVRVHRARAAAVFSRGTRISIARPSKLGTSVVSKVISTHGRNSSCSDWLERRGDSGLPDGYHVRLSHHAGKAED